MTMPETDTIGQGLAVQALTRRTSEPNAGLVVYAQYLEASARELVAAKGKPAVEQQLRWSLAQAHGVVAYLMWALHDSDQGAASDAGWEITEMCEAGEPMADWVTEQLVKLGVDVEALIADEQTRNAEATA